VLVGTRNGSCSRNKIGAARCRLLAHFWIEFENGEQSSRKGHTELQTVLKQLAARG
jgi:hypothetical protein